jgi:hypothetical protein
VLQVGPNPDTYGQAVTLTALISAPGSGIVDGGQVRFVDGTNQVGVAPVSNGAAVLTLAGLRVGTHDLQAYYDGDASFGSSLSPIATADVEPAPSLVTLTTSAAGAPAGTVALVALVAPWIAPGSPSPAAAPTGIVQFFIGDQLLGDATLGHGGVAVLSVVPPASSAVSTIHASYQGDGNYLSAASAAVNVDPATATVGPASSQSAAPSATTTVVDVSVGSTARRHGRMRMIQIVAHVTATGGQAVTGGDVTFVMPHRRPSVVTVNDGLASLDLSMKKRKRSWVTASFSGTPTLLPSASAAVSLSRRAHRMAALTAPFSSAWSARRLSSSRSG